MKKYKFLTAALCAVVLMCGFATPAFASAEEEIEVYTGGYEEPAATQESVIVPGVGFTEDGTLITRDMLYDEHTNKQFITVQTSGGNTFYIVIDYDKPVDEDGEQYYTYFLNMVDEADLLAVIEDDAMPAACNCTDKCVAGAVNTACPVCAANMSECAGTEAKPAEDPIAGAEPDAAESTGGNSGMLILAVIVVLAAGGAGYYFKIYRPKHNTADEYEDSGHEDAEPENEDYDDGPPWDEDEAEESGDEE